MRPFSTDHLRALAAAYCAATGITLYALGERAASNGKLFKRLAAGLDCTAGNAESASRWFAENWPADAPWPVDVPLPDRNATNPIEAA